MTVGRTVWGAEDNRRIARTRGAQPMPPQGGFERFMWYFMRVSGVLLVLLALGHMFIMHVLVPLGGGEINFALIIGRWGSPFWRVYDGLLLLLAMVHGINGARIVIGDYARHGVVRNLAVGLLLLAGGFLILLGILVILFFDPSTAPPVGPMS
jgi:succinate dehydrogenase / fumarate reductase membrane anchor subunit